MVGTSSRAQRKGWGQKQATLTLPHTHQKVLGRETNLTPDFGPK